MKPDYWEQAIGELSARDPILRALIKRFPGISLRGRGDAFSTLARSIVGQQISVKAAERVWQRFATSVGEMTPPSVWRTSPERLREAGLSRQKVLYLHDLARRFAEGTLLVPRWQYLEDEALIAELTQVKGIGRWTAEMFLMFHLLRPDVLPVDDLGLQKAVRLLYNRGRALPPGRLKRLGKVWAPWRSVATWYLWRSLEPIPIEY